MTEFREKGLLFPTGIVVGLTVMVLWNMFFVYTALRTAPEVGDDYTHAVER